MLNYYQILEVQEDASSEEIKKSFKKLAFQYHPDMHPDDEEAKQKIVKIIEAYDVLIDPFARKWYNIRGDNNDILSHFAAVYKAYLDNRAHRYELIRQELEAERKEVKAAYENAGKYVPLHFKLALYLIFLFLSIEALIYDTSTLTFSEKEALLFLFSILILGLSFVKIANILYLESLFNKHFNREGRIHEENIPYYMFYILVAGFGLFYLQPKEILDYILANSLTR